MKRFKDFSKDIDDHKKNRLDRQMLSWESGFGEVRDKNEEDPTQPMLSWKGGFGEIRPKTQTKEDVVYEDVTAPASASTLNPKVHTPGSRSHFMHHTVEFYKNSEAQAKIENKLNYTCGSEYESLSKKRNAVYEKLNHHSGELSKHYPAKVAYNTGELFGRWGGLVGRDHPISTVRTLASQHYEKHLIDKKIAGTKPYTMEHAKAVLDGVSAHKKNYENRFNMGTAGHQFGGIHDNWARELKNDFHGTYKEHGSLIADAHRNGDLKSLKHIFSGYAASTAPSISGTDEARPKFLGAPAKSVNSSIKPISHWFEERRRHENAPSQSNLKGYSYHKIHEHPDIRPTMLSEDHRATLEHFTGSGSSTMNGYLRHRAGDNTGNPGYGAEQHKNTESYIQKMTSAFTTGNTNRKDLHTWSGVPHHVGSELMASPLGASHNIAGFTSTSTSKDTANKFSVGYANGSGHDAHHIIHYKVKKGAGLSIAHMSGFNENEVVLHHGAKIRYRGTTHYKGTGNKNHTVERRKDLYVHHVTVHPEHIPLHKYGPIQKNFDPEPKPKPATPKQKAETDNLAKELEGHF